MRRVGHYSLYPILAVGCRVSSKEGTAFRRWATSVLRDRLLSTVGRRGPSHAEVEAMIVKAVLAALENPPQAFRSMLGVSISASPEKRGRPHAGDRS
jgi:Virulence protein RhuM family